GNPGPPARANRGGYADRSPRTANQRIPPKSRLPGGGREPQPGPEMKTRNVVYPAVAGVLVIALWYALHFAIGEDRRFLLPRPDAIVAAFRENQVLLLHATFNTGMGALLGLLAAVAVSFALALALSLSPLVRA